MAPREVYVGATFRVVHGAKMLGGDVVAIAPPGLWRIWQ